MSLPKFIPPPTVILGDVIQDKVIIGHDWYLFLYNSSLQTQQVQTGNYVNPFVVPNGSTATTQVASDNSTNVATDAFVHALISAGFPGAFSTLSASSVVSGTGFSNYMTAGLISGQPGAFSTLSASGTVSGTGMASYMTAGLASGQPGIFSTVKTSGYTVATLPAGAIGMRAYVTDATAPTWLGSLTGGGAVKCPVFYNGTAWVAG
jgi:hypothetical protein